MTQRLFALFLVFAFAGTLAAQPNRRAQIDIVVKRNKSTDSETEVNEHRHHGHDEPELRRRKTTDESFAIEAKVRNKEIRRTFRNITADVYVFAENLETDELVLVRKASETFDLLPRAEHIVHTPEVNLTRVKDGRDESGQEYGGYVVVIKDENGITLRTRATRSSMLRKLPQLEEASEGDTID